jgi:hypothetical protein
MVVRMCPATHQPAINVTLTTRETDTSKVKSRTEELGGKFDVGDPLA